MLILPFATIVGLVNSTRQIKDSKNKPITFVNFDDEKWIYGWNNSF
ncbi:MAG: hypothetical protein Ct9H90mP6_00560 [Gammaproteobacteria bacterium]|nr:MAG: hypothetical protein Ct9H90mP6_00560 [Gammaproteobacteria bacterium]